MIERYAFRYTEYLMQQRWKQAVFAPAADDVLQSDMLARLTGAPMLQGVPKLLKLGILTEQNTPLFEQYIPLVETYGADAVRCALVLNPKCSIDDDVLFTSGWRQADKVWQLTHKMGNNIDIQNAAYYPLLTALQKKDFKAALIELNTLIKTEHAFSKELLLFIYPFMPHLVTRVCGDIHLQMADFWADLMQMHLPQRLFIEINGKSVMSFFTQEIDEQKIIKQALSFDKIQNKIKGKPRIIFIPRKGINIVVS